ncbi:two-component system response regulator [Paradesertivirga mongoliensis]|uniref:Two-component system response regulator n=2 Tax=Paradesertivirga mongoliensis TaxID=2100740 RepID=A0ABW4ZPW7_9SPHI
MIDDDVSCLEIMQMVVNDLGYETYAFPTWTSETIQQIIDIAPDVIILDEWLIGVKGSELCVILKSINQLRTVPVVLISGVDGLAEIAKRSFADGYINKPFAITDLEKMVTEL